MLSNAQWQFQLKPGSCFFPQMMVEAKAQILKCSSGNVHLHFQDECDETRAPGERGQIDGSPTLQIFFLEEGLRLLVRVSGQQTGTIG